MHVYTVDSKEFNHYISDTKYLGFHRCFSQSFPAVFEMLLSFIPTWVGCSGESQWTKPAWGAHHTLSLVHVSTYPIPAVT